MGLSFPICRVWMLGKKRRPLRAVPGPTVSVPRKVGILGIRQGSERPKEGREQG